jgi:hypothetical protein
MVFTAGQTTLFFEDAAQMGIPHATVVQLIKEGIDEVQDLAEFDRDNLTQVADNLRCPEGCIPNPDPACCSCRSNNRSTVFQFRSKSSEETPSGV